MARRSSDQLPAITLVTTVTATVVGTVVMLLTVYSGLLNEEVWQVALSMYFLTLLPVSGWIFRPKRRARN